MTTPSQSAPPAGWGESLPLPLTPQGGSSADQGDVSTANRAIRRASTDAERARSREIGGPRGPEPTRYNDWEQKGRCSDF
jgi:hypothetical protein